jgi:hypothetical protein
MPDHNQPQILIQPLKPALIAGMAPHDPGALLGLAQCLDQLGGDYGNEATATFKQVLKLFADHPVADIARKAINSRSNDDLHATVDGGMRLDAVMYMRGAMEDFAKMPREQVGRVVMEIATLGENGLQINDPNVRYTLRNKPGDYSGLHLLAMMHVGLKLFDANADSGSGLDREYAAALAFRKP